MLKDINFISSGNKYYKLLKKGNNRFRNKVKNYISNNNNQEIKKHKLCQNEMLLKRTNNKIKQDKVKQYLVKEILLN